MLVVAGGGDEGVGLMGKGYSTFCLLFFFPSLPSLSTHWHLRFTVRFTTGTMGFLPRDPNLEEEDIDT